MTNQPTRLVSPEKRALSVSELTRIIRGLLEGEPALSGVWVRGETSNVRKSPTGHLYFTLKDENAEISCVIFNFTRDRKRELQEGVSLLAFGDVGVYEKRGVYQLVVRDFILRGEGELAQQFEALKRKLSAEGLFDEGHKLALPPFPQTVGIVTSRDAAALKDVIKVLSRRAPYVRAILIAAPVQGEGAANSIIKALQRAESSKLADVILLVRGGGSLEDLWCFNSEALARAIYELKVPVITGVGHEIDFTIADFVADRRAPTPSAAAEVVAPDVAGLRDGLFEIADRVGRIALSRLRVAETEFRAVKAERLVTDVLERTAAYESSLADFTRISARSVLRRLRSSLESVAEKTRWLSAHRILRRVEERMDAIDAAAEQLVTRATRAVASREHQIDLASARVKAVDPQETLKRGYALIWNETRTRLLRSIEEAPAGTMMAAELRDGYLHAEVSKAESKDESEAEPSQQAD